MPCDYRILQSPPKRTSKTCPFGDRATVSTRTKKMIVALPKVKTSAKSVQTSAVVCTDYTCSLHRLQLKSPESTTYLQI